MDVAVVGVSFRQANVDMRENFIVHAKKHFANVPHVFLTTCNRAEVYSACPQLNFAPQAAYTLLGEECFTHLARVTAGLDSAILGESEIQRQVKEAYAAGGKLPSELHFLFQKSLQIGKMIRTLYAASYGMGEVARRFISRFVTPVDPLLFIGYSEINRQIMDHLLKWGWQNLSLCTKSPDNVTQDIHVFDYTKLTSWTKYPAVIVGAKETQYLLSHPMNKIKTTCLIDLSVPRTVDPSLAPHISQGLWNIDHLTHFQAAEFSSPLDSAPLETLISTKVAEYSAAYAKKMAISF